jgi:hypothetical protein
VTYTRRQVLAGACALPFARRARAFGATTRVDIAEIQLSSGTLSRVDGWKRLLHEVIQTTSVEADPSVVQLSPDDPALFAHPFAVLVGNGPLPALSDRAAQQLGRYLAYGGFLYLDDATGTEESGFDRSVRAMVARLYPTRPFAVLSSDHSIFRSFFLLREAVGRVALHRTLEGIPHTTTHPLVYGRDDLSGALDRRVDGSDAQACVPGGEVQRREAVKLGVNLVLYALTSNYKRDATHVNELMRDGRLE